MDPGIDTMGAESKRNGGMGKLMESYYFARVPLRHFSSQNYYPVLDWTSIVTFTIYDMFSLLFRKAHISMFENVKESLWN